MLNSLYSNLIGDFIATANSGAKTITFSSYASSVLSATIATKSFLGASIKRVNTSGQVDTLPLTNISFTSNVLTLSGMSANFAVGDQVAVVLIGPDKGFDETNDVQKMSLFFQVAGENLDDDVLGTQEKPIVGSTYAWSLSKMNGTDVDISVKTAAGNARAVSIFNGNAATRYLHIFNKASAPASSDVPVIVEAIKAGEARTINLYNYYLSTGIAWGVSTVAATFTAATAADHVGTLWYT